MNSKGELFTYHTLPEITSVSPNTGGLNGKTHIQIKGNSFDAYPGKTRVVIGKTDCEIVSINSTDLTCLSPEKADMQVAEGGPRGLLYEAWVTTVTDDYSTLSTEAPDYRKSIIDNSTVQEKVFFDQVKGFTARLRGLFVAPYTGNLQFLLRCSSNCKLNWSNTSDSSVLEQLLHWPNGNRTGNSEGKFRSRKIEVVKGQEYYIEALHTHEDKEIENFLQISLWQSQTIFHGSSSNIITDERQHMRFNVKRKYETQKITLNGITSEEEITFTQAGKESEVTFPVAIEDAKSSWKGKFNDMLVMRCDAIHIGKLYVQDYEDPNYRLPGAGGWFNDQAVPFCGKRSLERQTRLMHRYGRRLIDAQRYKYLCFATKGTSFKGQLSLLVWWQKSDGKMKARSWVTLKDLWVPSNEWEYHCFNWNELLRNTTMSGLNGIKEENPRLEIEDVQTPIHSGSRYWWHDQFSITEEEVDLKRNYGAVPSDRVHIASTDFKWTDDDSSAEVSIKPRTCNEEKDDFHLFGVKDADIVGLDLSGVADKNEAIQNYLKTNDEVTFTKSSWGGGTISISRKERGSRAITGNYSLSWKNKTIENLPPDLKADELEQILESEFGMVGIRASYYNKHCAWRELLIEFKLTSLTGDVDKIEINATNLSVNNAHWTRFQMLDNVNGGAYIKEMGGDFFRLKASEPLVSVYVNDFLASCTSKCVNQGQSCNEMCKYDYSADVTPTLLSVSASDNNGETELTITGEKFSANTDDYVINVGQDLCETLTATANEVKCKLEPGPAGTFDLNMIIKSRGEATQPSSGQLTFKVALAVVSISPVIGSIGGGTLVTVIGKGFPNSVNAWENNTITVAGQKCLVTESSFNQIKCLTSEGSDGLSGSVEVTVNNEVASNGIFTYDASASPRVNSYSPTTASPLGGGILLISGASLGAKWGKVFIGEAKCELVTWIDSEITCIIPRNSHGSHKVYVVVPDNGYASTEGLDPFIINFKVTNMIPKVGSPLGGSTVKISGLGFGNCSNVEISMGNILYCKILSCTDTEITCKTERQTKTVVVDNGGKHPRYGLGYAWNPSEVSIMPGDSVKWIWSLTTSSSGSGINIFQTDDAKVDMFNDRGFNTGDKRKSGTFTQTFTAKGNYLYTSEPVKINGPIMRGKVIVKESIEDEAGKLNLLMEDIPAFHEVESSTTGSINDIDGCSITEVNSCANEPTITDNFVFLAAPCLQAKVNKILVSQNGLNATKPNYILDAAQLTITGQGFSTKACQNEVNIGQHSCKVDTATATSIVCTFEGNPEGQEGFKSLNKEFISLNVLNSGNAIMADENTDMGQLVLYPEIKSVNLAEGSWTGGNILILSGKGLLPHGGMETVQVIFGEEGFQASCSVISVTYDAISCLVPDYRPFKGIDQEKAVPVAILLGYKQVMPKQATDVIFTFKDTLLSTATAISTATIIADTDVTITGTNFGSLLENVNIFAIIPNSQKRRKRSIPEHITVEENISEPESKWKKMGVKYWRCPEKGICSNEEITSNIEEPITSRDRRSVEFNQESLEDDERFTLEICQELPNECHERLERVYGHSNNRNKRSDEYEDLLELSPLLENSYEATIKAVTETSITFAFVNLPAGSYELIVNMEGAVGNSDVSFGQVISRMTVNSVVPASGSLNGGHLITINGGGFSGQLDDTVVQIGDTSCTITETSPSVVKCITAPCTENCGDLVVTSNKKTATSTSYSYSASSSPVVTSVTGMAGTQISIQGSNFGTNPAVKVGRHSCPTDSATATEVKCTMPLIAGGVYPVVVNNPDLGNSNNDITWTVDLKITSSSPTSGSYGGGTLITIVGEGFDQAENMNISICENLCHVNPSTSSSTEIKCLAPANSGEDATLNCDIVISQESGTVTKSAGFIYDKNLTPTISTVDPLRGGTGGGTLITITGTGFSATGNAINIDGSKCDIATESETEITCYTNYHNGAIKAPVILDVPGKGYADYEDVTLATFYYIDRWSSIWTWGGLGTPLEGEFIVITPGMTILLDTDTPVLKFLLINGGTLMFDEENPNIELQAEYILIAGGGSLQIGTEEKPYTSKATITMHGNVRCTEMPVFGCKVRIGL